MTFCDWFSFASFSRLKDLLTNIRQLMQQLKKCLKKRQLKNINWESYGLSRPKISWVVHNWWDYYFLRGVKSFGGLFFTLVSCSIQLIKKLLWVSGEMKGKINVPFIKCVRYAYYVVSSYLCPCTHTAQGSGLPKPCPNSLISTCSVPAQRSQREPFW